MHLLHLTTALVAVTALAAQPKWHQLSSEYSFAQYVRDFRKSYASPVEYLRRQTLFQAELASVLRHNARTEASYRQGVNHMSDWTTEEKSALLGGRYDPSIPRPHETIYKAVPRAKTLPVSVDYRNAVPAVLTAVKDQGFCGDCWAHAVTESIESSYAIATGELYVLSQQQVTSCTPATGGCYSCNGSFPTLGFEYVASAGITEEWLYPFESYNGSFPKCRKDPTSNPHYPLQTSVNISGYTSVTSNSQSDTMAALSDLGPLAILVAAGKWSSYESGIFDGCSYDKNISIDHAVMLVGYGSENGHDYWIVRNSWSPAWGEEGYIRLTKPSKPQCGWNGGAGHSNDCYGVGPASVWSCGQCGVLFNPQFPLVFRN